MGCTASSESDDREMPKTGDQVGLLSNKSDHKDMKETIQPESSLPAASSKKGTGSKSSKKSSQGGGGGSGGKTKPSSGSTTKSNSANSENKQKSSTTKSSKPASNGTTKAPAPAPPPPKPKVVRPRVESSKESVWSEINGIRFRYAFLSQRGNYPDEPNKPNQDSYCIHESITKGRRDAFFGVFDGHGKDGDGCALYAREHMPKQVKEHIAKAITAHGSVELTKGHVQNALVGAHVDTNKGLHADPTVDDSLSGTTAVSIYFHGRKNRITVSNVGDSRAVLGQELPTNDMEPRKESARNKYKAFPLSRDQTPYRKDERKRIRATGARILSLDQLEGLEPVPEASENEDFELGEELDEGGDPPRVWHPTGDYPGTAFTRSIGDAMAEELGVYAEPEMLTREIVPEDKILVIASDGVYEFLTNQSVIDICAKFTDPLEACRAVVAEAYELWLQYELRTDDITMICIFIDDVRPDTNRRSSMGSMLSVADLSTYDAAHTTQLPPNVTSTMANATAGKQVSLASMTDGLSVNPDEDDEVDNVTLDEGGLKPVRKNVSKAGSKAIEKFKQAMRSNDAQEETVDWRKLATTKTPEEKEGIADAIKASVMFRNINDAQREMVFACMESVHVKAGEWVIRQGTQGDRFYVIDEGRFEVRIVPDGEEDETGEGGNTVHVYEGSRARNSHPAFGELALMYSAPRTASIMAQTDGHLWALHRAAFRQILLEAQDDRKDLKRVLSEIPYFQYLDSDGINKLAAIMNEITYGRGENITEQGRSGDKMYVIASGSCYTVQMVPGKTKRSNMNKGAYFGDEILSSDGGKYNMTVVTLQTTRCWQLDVSLMKQTMGPLLQGEAS